MITTSAAHRDRTTASWRSKSSRTAFRRASGSARNPARRWPRPRLRSRPCGRTARGRSSRWPTAADFCESVDEIPEPHDFTATCDRRRDASRRLRGARARTGRGGARQQHARRRHPCDGRRRRLAPRHRRPALAPWLFGWLWMDPLAGIVGALVIASWSTALIRDTGAILLDMNPDRRMADEIRARDRGRRRPARRPASLAARPGPSRRDRFGGHADRATEAGLSRQARALPRRCRI